MLKGTHNISSHRCVVERIVNSQSLYRLNEFKTGNGKEGG